METWKAQHCPVKARDFHPKAPPGIFLISRSMAKHADTQTEHHCSKLARTTKHIGHGSFKKKKNTFKQPTLWTSMSLRAALSSPLSVADKRWRYWCASLGNWKIVHARGSKKWGSIGCEWLKHGALWKGMKSDSPNASTAAPENH